MTRRQALHALVVALGRGARRRVGGGQEAADELRRQRGAQPRGELSGGGRGRSFKQFVLLAFRAAVPHGLWWWYRHVHQPFLKAFSLLRCQEAAGSRRSPRGNPITKNQYY